MTTVYVAKIACQNERDRKAYAEVARQLLKEAVKREYSLDISAYVEKKSENGKPYLVGAPFHFNLSHSKDYVVCALSDCDVGVDIEKVRPISEGVMRRFVGTCTESDEANTRLWTRYEAIGKFLGVGIPYKTTSDVYFVKEYFDLDGYAVTVCAEKDSFTERLVILSSE
ncbi:MAG: hypothetical protein IJD35_04970 [Clostridia bacterium]|nr:hypothetical protein [Clostridia bacterium]